MAVYQPSSLVPLRVVVTDPTTGAAANAGAVTFTVTRPDGTTYTTGAITPSPVGTYDHDVDVAGTVTASSGGGGQTGQYVWRAVATTPLPGEFDGWFIVRARRAPEALPWLPDLEAVADWIPARTLSSIATPGVETYLGTFTASTTPTDEQVRRQIDAAVQYVQSEVGTTVAATLYDQARTAAACVAAAFVELSFPNRLTDLNTYDKLWAQATALVTSLSDANVSATGNPASLAQTLLPEYAYPDPVPWGDSLIP